MSDGGVDAIVRAARNGAKVINARPRPIAISRSAPVEDRARQTEEAALAAWLALNKPKKLRKGRANAPPISKIRQAMRHGGSLAVRRSGGRTVIYGHQPQQGIEGNAAGEYLRAAARPRRRRRRSAKKPPA